MPKKISPAALLVLFLSLGFVIFQAQQSQESRSRAAITNCTVSASDYALDTEEQNFIKLVNQYRQTKGAPALKVSPNLSRSAAWHSREMASKENMTHTDSFGRDPGARTAACGYVEKSDGWTGENIAYGEPGAAGTISQWKSDVPHDTAMTDPTFTVLGIARAKSSSGDWYWTYDAGRRDDSSGALPTSAPSQPSPTNVVPSPTCLGASCTTPEPTQAEEEVPPPDDAEILPTSGAEEPGAPGEDISQPSEEETAPTSAPNPPSDQNPLKKPSKGGLLEMLLDRLFSLLDLLFGGK